MRVLQDACPLAEAIVAVADFCFPTQGHFSHAKDGLSQHPLQCQDRRLGPFDFSKGRGLCGCSRGSVLICIRYCALESFDYLQSRSSGFETPVTPPHVEAPPSFGSRRPGMRTLCAISPWCCGAGLWIRWCRTPAAKLTWVTMGSTWAVPRQ